MTSQNGATQTFSFSIIPLDCCPHCDALPEERWGIGIPVAISIQGPQRWIVRNTCPTCRLIWDTSWNVSGDEAYGPFDDGFIRYSVGVRSYPQGASVFPVGPRHLLEQRAG